MTVSPLDTPSQECPETHFHCPGRVYYCLPVYIRCNGINDCPGHADEMWCDSVTCPGFYRCRASPVCLHPDHVCDGLYHCPQLDDELFCDLLCPRNCTCYAQSFFCRSQVSLYTYIDVRYLDAQGSDMKPDDLINNVLLVYLSLASCNLQKLALPSLKNLLTLDLSDNLLTSVNRAQFSPVKQLRALILAGNPLNVHQTADDWSFPSILLLDLSNVLIPSLNVSVLEIFPNLQVVNLSNTGMITVMGKWSTSLRNLRVLDLRGCSVTHFPYDMLHGLNRLQAVTADNYKLCCQLTLPEGFNLNNCQAPADELFSCEALLRSNAYRVLLVLFTVSALLCNLVSFVFRLMSSRSVSSGFVIFVMHLCVSDFLMGVYLTMIGLADWSFGGIYLWKEMQWRHSAACHLAGFLSLLSSEVSAFTICIITLDRFLVLQFPFSHLHFHKRSSHVTCGVVWCVGVILAVIPLLPVTSHWEYYSQTGICIPLPITIKQFPGQKYSFSIMVVLNFLLFLMIAVGQCIIYCSIRTSSMASADPNKKSKDQTIARRLITVAMSDFLCWFPIGILGLLASNNYTIRGEWNVAIAIIVMPLNSSLNPFLYTLNVILEQRQRRKEAQIYKRLMLQIQNKAISSAGTKSAKD